MVTNPVMVVSGACSWFGGPNDGGVKEDEGLALFGGPLSIHPLYRRLFIKSLDPSRGLARQLNPDQFYCAMRWDYTAFNQSVLRQSQVRVTAGSGLHCWCSPVDWGPNVETERVIDVSMGVLIALGIETDSIVKVELFV